MSVKFRGRRTIAARNEEAVIRPPLRVIPAKAGIQGSRSSLALDPRFRGGDN